MTIGNTRRWECQPPKSLYRWTEKWFNTWIVWLLIHILFLIGFRNKLSVLLGWAYSYIVNNPEARIIVYPPASVAPQHK